MPIDKAWAGPVSSRQIAGIISGSLLVLLSFCLVLIADYAYMESSWSYEFSHYAEIASQLDSSGHWQTNFIFPAELYNLSVKKLDDVPPWPFTSRFPLLVVVIALAFHLFGVGDLSVVIALASLLALLVLVVYLGGQRLFSRRCALLAALTIAATPVFWKFFALFGFSCFLFATLTFLHFLLLTQLLTQEGTRFWWFVMPGLLAGVNWLARFNAILFLPVTIIVIWCYARQRHWAKVSLYLAGFLTLFLPVTLLINLNNGNAAHAVIIAGNFAHFTAVDQVPWLFYRNFAISNTLVQHWPVIAAKALRSFFVYLKWFFHQYEFDLLVPFAVCGLLVNLRGPESRQRQIFRRLYLPLLDSRLWLDIFAYRAYGTLFCLVCPVFVVGRL